MINSNIQKYNSNIFAIGGFKPVNSSIANKNQVNFSANPVLKTLQRDTVSFKSNTDNFQNTVQNFVENANLPEEPGFSIPFVMENEHDKLARLLVKNYKESSNLEEEEKNRALCEVFDKTLSPEQVDNVLGSLQNRNFNGVFTEDYSECFKDPHKRNSYNTRRAMNKFITEEYPKISLY